jgi:hypothetical protein
MYDKNEWQGQQYEELLYNNNNLTLHMSDQ